MKIALTSVVLAGLVAACGSSIQPPTDRLASTDAAIRSARELGAQSDPQAALHLKLADEQVAQARTLMKDGENKRADLVLQRASSDAELAVMMTKERNAKSEADQARQVLNTTKGQPSTTTTTTTTTTNPPSSK